MNKQEKLWWSNGSLCCELLFHSLIPLTLLPPHQSLGAAPGPEFLFAWFYFSSYKDPGQMGRDGFKRRLSKRLMHYNEKRHLYSQRALSVSVHVGRSTEAEYRRPLSFVIRSGVVFPTHTSFYFFDPSLTPNIHTIPFSLPPSFLSTLKYPVFHSAAQWAVWMCLVSYVTSFLESLPPVWSHCITCQLLCTSQRGSLFSGFLRHKYDPPPNGGGIKPGAESQIAPPPPFLP